MTRRKILPIPFCSACYHCLQIHGDNGFICGVTGKTIKDEKKFNDDCPINEEQTINDISEIIFKNFSSGIFNEITASEKKKLEDTSNEILDILTSYIKV